MFRSQTPINTKPAQDSIVLACLASGVHVQVGAPATREGARALHTVLDADQSGFQRSPLGKLYMGAPTPHYILGAEVKFYRVREGSHEFGSIAQVPVNRVARSAPRK